MRADLIQTYTNNLNNMPNKNKRDLNIEQILSNRTFIKPLPGKGHMIRSTIFDAPAIWAKDVTYNYQSLKKSGKGKANDHELGKVNDIGMKLGGFAIALYLMTRKQTTLAKAMEFVGLGTFFGAMKLWPKLAIHLPAKLIHGFDVGRKYKDSYGRKKPFFEDPQYLPWDLADENKLNKIGDRMGIPRNIPNRRDYIQEKMKKIAIQNNTMWMLTAGFATPILSALMCNVLEKPLSDSIDAINATRAKKLLSNLGKKEAKFANNKAMQKLDALLVKDSVITPKTSEEIKKIITEGLDPITAKAIYADIDGILGIAKQQYSIEAPTVNTIVVKVKESLSKVLKDSGNVLIDDKVLVKKLESYFGRELNDFELKKIQNVVGSEIRKALQSANIDPEEAKAFIDTILNKEKVISSTLKSNTTATLNTSNIENIKKIAKTIFDFKGRSAVLDKYVYLKAGAAPGTVAANAWNEVAGNLPKLLNFTDKEIIAIRHDRKLAGKLLREKLEILTLPENSAEYERVFTALRNKIKELESKISVETAASGNPNGYGNIVHSVFGNAAKELKELNMFKTVEKLIGKSGDNAGSLEHIQLSYAKDRLLGIKSSMYRLLNTFDFFKRISTQTNIEALHGQMPKEMKEEIVELAKQLSIEGTTSDFMTKFYALRNPKASKELGTLAVDNAGKIINEYLGKAVSGGRVDIPNDSKFFEEVMKLLFENEIHPESKQILSGAAWEQGLVEFRSKFLKEIGNHEYFAKFFHKVNNGTKSNATTYEKFLMLGSSPEQMLSNSTKQMFNTKKWLKIFGGFALGLLAVTVISQFFFGKTEDRSKDGK